MAGVVLFGGFWFVCFAVLCRAIFLDYVQKHIYYFNVGQCIAEGMAIHGTLIFAVTAVLLYWNRRILFALLSGCCAVVLAGVGFDALYWEPYHLKVEYYTIESAKVKHPLRIVFVADIQTDRIGSHEINTLKAIQQQHADLIILGGDYLQTFAGTRETQLPEKFRQMLIDHPLKAPLGVYAIEGNIRDVKVSDSELFRETGVEFFQNSTIFDDIGNEEGKGPIDLVLLSLGDSWGNLGKRGLTESGNFIVMAGHCPNYAIDGYTSPRSGRSLSGYRDADKAPDLMLAGHTHGGQVVFPFYGPVTFWGGGDGRVQQVPRHMRSGFFTYPNGGHLLVTRGSGLERGWAPRVRFFCPAEICVIDIRPAL
jgi:predicted MPP superfamily phosphohydrolase